NRRTGTRAARVLADGVLRGERTGALADDKLSRAAPLPAAAQAQNACRNHGHLVDTRRDLDRRSDAGRRPLAPSLWRIPANSLYAARLRRSRRVTIRR